MNTFSRKYFELFLQMGTKNTGEIFESCSDKIKHGFTDDLIGPSISGDDLLRYDVDSCLN